MSSSKLERDKQKLIQDKCQQILTDLLKDEDNKYCVDCDAKGPRWASWNLGIFLCIRCAGIHRNLGVHISRVKSVNLDSWTPEQVGSILNMGNSKARAVYEAKLPDNFTRPQADSPLETFIRAKYEHKKYIASEWTETPPKPAFDIDELLRKEKENKRSKIKPIASIGTLSSDIAPNSVPRPSASSAAPAATSGQTSTSQKAKPAAATNTTTSSATDDLLGLNLDPVPSSAPSADPQDAFGLFLDATPNGSDKSKTLEQEEKEFFTQTSKEEKKLTKESILSLYSQTNGIRPIVPNGVTSSLNNQFADLTLHGTLPSAPTVAAANTNPFLASATGVPQTNNLNFGAFGSAPTQFPTAIPNAFGANPLGAAGAWPTQNAANPLGSVAKPTNPSTDLFDAFKTFSSTAPSTTTANSLNNTNNAAIPSFANFSAFNTSSSNGNAANSSSNNNFW